ncbi:amidohydrolase family protein [Acetobacteraceae bacterium AT-5844]|nr:amidohydrolase family protein [Acetobacteraceae bacterium AT-5844]
MRRIDAHQHYWAVSRGDYGWLTPSLEPIFRDFGPADLAPSLSQCGIDATVLVQAAPTMAETRYLLELASRTPSVAGVVGWVPFDEDDAVLAMEELADDPALVGLRPMVHDIEDIDWILRAELTAPLEAMARLGLVFDALVRPAHLSRLLTCLERHPDLSVVLDHAAKPDIRHRGFQPWATEIAALAGHPGVSCKLSGLLTEAPEGAGEVELRPYFEHLLSCFGPQRIIWGSDWPVLNLAASYERWWQVTEDLLGSLSQNDRAAILGGNAERIYLRSGRKPRAC